MIGAIETIEKHKQYCTIIYIPSDVDSCQEQKARHICPEEWWNQHIKIPNSGCIFSSNTK